MSSSLGLTPSTPSGSEKVRARATLLVIAIATFGFFGGFWVYSDQAVKQHEQRVIAGDYPDLHVETAPVTIEDGGKVIPDHLSKSQTHERYVASTRLIPAGRYAAVLIAHDGDAQHLASAAGAEMIIAAQDMQGRWFPPSAPGVIARIKTTATH